MTCSLGPHILPVTCSSEPHILASESWPTRWDPIFWRDLLVGTPYFGHDLLVGTPYFGHDLLVGTPYFGFRNLRYSSGPHIVGHHLLVRAPYFIQSQACSLYQNVS